ncbi:hypothetical protein OAC51_09290 [Flavobacteriaceae bacterium]|nr:hypothetical protein [Flavobacteriaceae bacterium]
MEVGLRPIQDMPAVQINNSDQVNKPFLHWSINNDGCPYLIGVFDL